MKEGTGINYNHFDFNKIICNMLKINVNLEEEDQTLLLFSLHLSLEHLVFALLYKKDKIDMEDVTSSLLLNELRKKGKDDHSSLWER